MACGILGIALKEDSEKLHAYAHSGMHILNHRGEGACGIAYLKGDGRIETLKAMGLVRDSNLFDSQISGSMLIGHTRYATSSINNMDNAQPMLIKLDYGIEFVIAHNGNITNNREIAEGIGFDDKCASDTRVLGMLLGRSLRNGDGGGKEIDRIRSGLANVVGSYSLLMMIGGQNPRIMAMRDKHGYMPLSVGENKEGFFVASESVAFGSNYLNADCVSVKPGEIVVIDRNGKLSYQPGETGMLQACMFQAIYMCRPESRFEGRNVYEIRERLGEAIARNYRPQVDCVVPVPDSGVSGAYGYNSVCAHIPIRMGLVRDRYVSSRQFMQDREEPGARVQQKKLNVVGEVVRGRSILLIDDSLVRGRTVRDTIAKLRDAGAREVHFASTCPPVISQCHYGIDFYNEQLLARKHKDLPRPEMFGKVAEEIGANSVYYNSIEDLAKAARMMREDLCVACLTGEYIHDVTAESRSERRG